MPASRTYFAVPYRLDGDERYFIWYSDEVDGVILAGPGRIATFAGSDSVAQFLAERDLVLEPEVTGIYDFDGLATWAVRPNVDALDCEALLNAWNMLSDIARSLSLVAHECKEAPGIYDKLFWGSNITAVTPAGEKFEPDWSHDELAAIARVLDAGLANVRAAAAFAS